MILKKWLEFKFTLLIDFVSFTNSILEFILVYILEFVIAITLAKKRLIEDHVLYMSSSLAFQSKELQTESLK